MTVNQLELGPITMGMRSTLRRSTRRRQCRRPTLLLNKSKRNSQPSTILKYSMQSTPFMQLYSLVRLLRLALGCD